MDKCMKEASQTIMKEGQYLLDKGKKMTWSELEMQIAYQKKAEKLKQIKRNKRFV